MGGNASHPQFVSWDTKIQTANQLFDQFGLPLAFQDEFPKIYIGGRGGDDDDNFSLLYKRNIDRVYYTNEENDDDDDDVKKYTIIVRSQSPLTYVYLFSEINLNTAQVKGQFTLATDSKLFKENLKLEDWKYIID